MSALRAAMTTTSWTILRHFRRNQSHGDVTKFCRRLGITSQRLQKEEEKAVGATSGRQDPLDHLRDNPFYSKYAEKLQDRQLVNPEEFSSRVLELEEEKRRAEERARQQLREHSDNQRQKQLQLDSVMKMDLVRDKSAEEIEALWTEYHRSKGVVFAVIPAAEYEHIMERAREYKTFLYPLPRAGGYEFFVQQFDGNQMHFTPLLELQVRGEKALSCLSITHFTELQRDKGIVLMRGEPDTDKLSVHEAQLLALQVKMYYGPCAALRFDLVRVMNDAPHQFKHMDLVKEFENFKHDHKLAEEEKKS